MTWMDFWRRRRVQRVVLQAGFVGVITLGLGAGVLTARKNLAEQGLSSGFDFLWKATGWDLNFTLLPTTASDPYWWYLLVGLLNTLFLGAIGLVFATLIGLCVGLARVSTNAPARLVGAVYVETFRNIPLIVQVFFWYAMSTQLPSPRAAYRLGDILLSGRGIYLPGLNISQGAAAVAGAVLVGMVGLLIWVATARRFQDRRRVWLGGICAAALVLTGLVAAYGRLPDTPLVSLPELAGLNIRGGIRIQPELYALAFAIAVYGGAYIGEIVRGGFKSVGRGQVEAAKALGLSPWQVFSRVRMPLAFRAMLPILINQYVWLIKATTLGITVGFSDFFMVIAGSITHSGQTIEFIGLLMAGFLLVNFSLAAVLNRINRAIALKGNQIGAA